jgi:hypothetical protein
MLHVQNAWPEQNMGKQAPEPSKAWIEGPQTASATKITALIAPAVLPRNQTFLRQ